jgi:hypothetical protein
MKRFHLAAVLLLGTIILSFSESAGAQVKTTLDELDQKIEHARRLLLLFPDQQAEKMFQQAVQLRERAVDFYARGRRGQARATIKAAVVLLDRIVNSVSRIPLERVRQQAEKSLHKAEKSVPGSGSEEARRYLKQALNRQHQGNKAARAGDPQRAIENYRVAKFLADRALNQSRGSSQSPGEMLEQERNKLQALLQKATRVATTCQNEQALKLLRQARSEYQTIQSRTHQRSLRMTLMRYYNATRLLLRAINLCEGNRSPVRELAITELDRIHILQSRIEMEKNDWSQFETILYQRIRRLVQQADQSITQNQYPIALKRLNLAARLLNKLSSSTPNPLLSDRIRLELKRLATRLEQQQNELTTPHQRRLWAAANSLNQSARWHVNKNRPRLALESILAANRLLNSLNGRDSQPLDSTQLDAQLNTLESRLQDYTPDSPNQQEAFKAASELYQEAVSAYQKNDFWIAWEYSRLAEKLLQGTE